MAATEVLSGSGGGGGGAHLVMGRNFFMQMRLKVPRKMRSHFPWGRLLHHHHRCSEASVYSQLQTRGVWEENLAARRSPK